MNRSSFANISQTLAKDHRNVDNCIELAQAKSPVPIFMPKTGNPKIHIKENGGKDHETRQNARSSRKRT
ncbi:MAG: hypothetical protein ACRC76_03710 [Proteocatella sp.]